MKGTNQQQPIPDKLRFTAEGWRVRPWANRPGLPTPSVRPDSLFIPIAIALSFCCATAFFTSIAEATVSRTQSDLSAVDIQDPRAQAATDAAFQELADRVLARDLADRLTVAGLMVAEPDVEYWLRRSLFEARQVAGPQLLPEGLVEVEVRVPADAAADLVRRLAERYFSGTEVTALLADAFADDMVAVGRSADPAFPAAPAGWRHCSPRVLESTAAAARIDLREHLLVRIEPWLISPVHTVGRLLGLRPDLRVALRSTYDRLSLPDPVFEPWGVCRVTATLPRATIVGWLTDAARLCRPPIDEDLTRAVDPTGEDPLIVYGYAVPPPAPAIEPTTPVEDHRPEWVGRTLIIQASHRIEVSRVLWLEIEELVIPGGATLADLFEAQDDPSKAMAIVDEAVGWSEPSPDQVAAELDLVVVWNIVGKLLRTATPPQSATRPPG